MDTDADLGLSVSGSPNSSVETGNGNSPTHLDLFSGIGGFALAAKWAGFETVAFCEIDPYCREVTQAHWPGVEHYQDVTKLCRRIYDCEYEEETGEANCPRCNAEFGECECIGTDQFTDTHGYPDLITGGVPCQPASLIGKRGGTDDERWLWPDTIRIMRELQPRFGVFENPPAILTLEGGRAWNGILSGLVEIGYDLWWELLPAYAVGAGHRRERVILVASDSDCAGFKGHSGNGGNGWETEPTRSNFHAECIQFADRHSEVVHVSIPCFPCG